MAPPSCFVDFFSPSTPPFLGFFFKELDQKKKKEEERVASPVADLLTTYPKLAGLQTKMARRRGRQEKRNKSKCYDMKLGSKSQNKHENSRKIRFFFSPPRRQSLATTTTAAAVATSAATFVNIDPTNYFPLTKFFFFLFFQTSRK